MSEEDNSGPEDDEEVYSSDADSDPEGLGQQYSEVPEGQALEALELAVELMEEAEAAGGRRVPLSREAVRAAVEPGARLPMEQMGEGHAERLEFFQAMGAEAIERAGGVAAAEKLHEASVAAAYPSGLDGEMREFQWTDDSNKRIPYDLPFTPRRTPGWYIPAHVQTPFQYFEHFLGDAFGLMHRSTQTAGLRRYGRAWRTLHEDEFRVFLSILACMDFMKMANVKSYWNREHSPFPSISRAMSHRRWAKIRAVLSCSDGAGLKLVGQDKLSKTFRVDEIVAKLNRTFLEAREADRILAGDEVTRFSTAWFSVPSSV